MDGGGHPPSRAGNGTFTPRNSPRIPDLQFVQISEITICYFTPLFLVFGGPTPLECPESRPPPVQTTAEVEQTRPVRGLCSDWANCVLVRCCTPSGAMLARCSRGREQNDGTRLVDGGFWRTPACRRLLTLPGGHQKARYRPCTLRSSQWPPQPRRSPRSRSCAMSCPTRPPSASRNSCGMRSTHRSGFFMSTHTTRWQRGSEPQQLGSTRSRPCGLPRPIGASWTRRKPRQCRCSRSSTAPGAFQMSLTRDRVGSDLGPNPNPNPNPTQAARRLAARDHPVPLAALA